MSPSDELNIAAARATHEQRMHEMREWVDGADDAEFARATWLIERLRSSTPARQVVGELAMLGLGLVSLPTEPEPDDPDTILGPDLGGEAGGA